MIATLFLISIFGGFLSGYLGLGGAVVMIPLMLTIPPLVNVECLSMKAVAGLSMVQVLFSSASGILIHKKNNFVHFNILLLIGIPMGVCSLLGSYLSKYMDDRIVLIIFGIMVIISFFMLIINNNNDDSDIQISDIAPNKNLAVLIGTITGILAGVVGAGGGFLIIPLMTRLLKIPLKITIGTSLGIVFIGALFGAIGKLITLQVDYLLIIPIVIGSLLSAPIGAKVSKKTAPNTLKYILIFIIIISFVQVIIKLL